MAKLKLEEPEETQGGRMGNVVVIIMIENDGIWPSDHEELSTHYTTHTYSDIYHTNTHLN